MESNLNAESDSFLLQQFVRSNDAVAFDQLARRYRGMVFSIARRVTQSHHDAEDVAQGCFLELARKAGDIHKSIPAFLHATATRRSIDLLRDQQRRKKHEQKAATARPEPDSASDAADRSWDEISPEVDRAIDALPDDLKTHVILYFLRGLSVPEIAMETGLNRSMIERRLQVGIRRLRADLSKGGRVVLAGVLAVGLKASSASAVPPGLTAATGRIALAVGLHAHLRPAARPPHSSLFRFRIPRWIGPVCAVAGMLSLLSLASLLWRSVPGQVNTPYDELKRVYAGYLPVGDSSGFAFHAAQMRTDTSSFWRGSQPLFFEWCKNNCRDWFADSASYARCQASPNLEDAEHLALSVNTDSSASIPIQIEMLQGMILIRLAADRDLGSASNNTARQVASALCESYRTSLLGDAPLPDMQNNDSNALHSDDYLDQSGNLNSIVLNSLGKPLAFLRPSPLEASQVEEMLTDAVSHAALLKNVCGTHPRVRAARACVWHDAVVTQGQLTLIVQLQGRGDLLEIKQQTPSPAELAQAVRRDPRSPGQRAAEDAAELTASGSAIVGWCTWDQKSFTVVPLRLHPQGYELRKDRWVDPVKAAKTWAVATAVTHRSNPARFALAAYITPELETKLVERSDAYLKSMQADLQAFRADKRVALDRATEDSALADWLEDARRSN